MGSSAAMNTIGRALVGADLMIEAFALNAIYLG
jgi:hypothetical protein